MPRCLTVALAGLLCLPLSADEFPAPYNSEPDIGAGPVKAEQVAADMQLPPASTLMSSLPSPMSRIRSPSTGTAAAGCGSPRTTPTLRPPSGLSSSFATGW